MKAVLERLISSGGLLPFWSLLAAATLASCGPSSSDKASTDQPPAAAHKIQLPKPDVLQDIAAKGRILFQPPASPWQVDESKVFFGVLTNHQADVLVVPFEIQDRGFDRIERSLMTADFAAAVARRTGSQVLNPYLVGRVLGEGQRRYLSTDIVRLANAVKARVLIREYVGHDGHGRLTLSVVVQRRSSPDRPWDQQQGGQRDWADLPFSDEDLPFRVVHRLQPEMLSFVAAPAGAQAADLRPKGGDYSLANWSPPLQPVDLVAPQERDPLRAASTFAILAALAPTNPERTRERLAERGLLLIDQSAEAPFLKGYLLHLLHRRPAAIAALGESHSPADDGLRAVLDGNLDSLKKAVPHAQSPFQSLLLEFELCQLHLTYTSKCDHAQLKESARLARLSPAWRFLVNSRLTDLANWDVQSNIEVKDLLDEAFPVPNFSLRDLVRAAAVTGSNPLEDSTIDLSVFRHIRKTLASEDSLPFYASEFPDRLDYLQLLEGLGESNLLKAVNRTGFLQGSAKEALSQLREYETVYAGHPDFTDLHADLLGTILNSTPDRPSVALYQEFERMRETAAYWEHGQTAISARILGSLTGPLLTLFADAYVQDFPMRGAWPLVDSVNRFGELPDYLAAPDRHEMMLSKIAYSETEIPPFFLEKPFLPPDDIRELLGQRFRGSPAAAQILAHLAGPEPSDPGVAYRDAIAREPAVWSNYFELGNWLLSNGNSEAAAQTYLKYPGFKSRSKDPATRVGNSNYAFESGSELYWRGAVESARKLYQIAANNDDGSYASITSAGRLALLRGDIPSYVASCSRAAQSYQASFSYRDYLSMLHVLGLHEQAWSGFGALAERFSQPEVWVSALVGQRMTATTPDQLRQWLLSDPIKKAHHAGQSLSADYALLWSSMDRIPSADLPQLIDQLQGPSKATTESDGLTTKRPSTTQEGAFELLAPSEFRRPVRKPVRPGTPVRSERTMFADAYVDLRAGRYAEAVNKFSELAGHYPLEMADERYVVPYLAYASAKAGDPLHFEEYLSSARVGGDFSAFLASAYFEGLHGHRDKALTFLKAAFYNRPFENTAPIFSEYQYAEACEWLFTDTHEDAYRQRALEWARMQSRMHPYLSWSYALEARLLAPGPERTRALAMTLYLDPLAPVLQPLSAQEKADLSHWLERNNPFSRPQKADRPAEPHVAT